MLSNYLVIEAGSDLASALSDSHEPYFKVVYEGLKNYIGLAKKGLVDHQLISYLM